MLFSPNANEDETAVIWPIFISPLTVFQVCGHLYFYVLRRFSKGWHLQRLVQVHLITFEAVKDTAEEITQVRGHQRIRHILRWRRDGEPFHLCQSHSSPKQWLKTLKCTRSLTVSPSIHYLYPLIPVTVVRVTVVCWYTLERSPVAVTAEIHDLLYLAASR